MDCCPHLIQEKLDELNLCQIEHYVSPESDNQNTQREMMLARIRSLIDKGIITLQNPELGIVQSIMERKYFIKKVTISFHGLNDKIKWTPLGKMKQNYDNEGNRILIDPIEDEIRDLSPPDAIKKVVKDRIEPLLNLKFEFIPLDSTEEGVIRIGFDTNKGSWSLIGIDHYFSTDKITMNFGWLDSGTILHEFGHFIGLSHEHQNPHGNEIKWNEPFIYKWGEVTQGWDKQKTYKNIIEKYNKNHYNGFNYDKYSIMHYFFPASFTLNNKKSQQNYRLSLTDVNSFKLLLPGKNINPNEFYKNIYPNNYKSTNNDTNNDTNNNTINFILLGIGIIIGLIIFFKFKN